MDSIADLLIDLYIFLVIILFYKIYLFGNYNQPGTLSYFCV